MASISPNNLALNPSVSSVSNFNPEQNSAESLFQNTDTDELLPPSPPSLITDLSSPTDIFRGNFESILDSDPSDYSVAFNDTIEVQASETIGHLADWLDLQAREIRELNNMNFRDQIIIGRKIQLDFGRVSRENFERLRRDFHSGLQRRFFSAYRIRGAEDYEIQRFDNIDRLALNRYSAPLWLVRQYNPGINFDSVYIGQKVTFPLLEATGSNDVN